MAARPILVRSVVRSRHGSTYNEGMKKTESVSMSRTPLHVAALLGT
jgi:hypothetical protein